MTTSTLAREALGGCLCGALRYRVSAGRALTIYCHCRMCQRIAGAPVVAWLTVATNRFAYVVGAPAIYRSSEIASREFCAVCGSHVAFRPVDRAEIDIACGTLDDPAIVVPSAHIWWESKIPWLALEDTLPHHLKGFPGP